MIPAVTLFRHSFWHLIWKYMANIFWHSILAFDLTGSLSGICSDILFGIPSRIYSDIFSGILSGNLSSIYFGILSGILSGNLSSIYFGLLSGILSDILFRHSIWHLFWHFLWHGHCRTSTASGQWPLWFGARGWGPAVPTEIWSSRLKSAVSTERFGSAHWDLAPTVEARQCPLKSGARDWQGGGWRREEGRRKGTEGDKR